MRAIAGVFFFIALLTGILAATLIFGQVDGNGSEKPAVHAGIIGLSMISATCFVCATWAAIVEHRGK